MENPGDTKNLPTLLKGYHKLQKYNKSYETYFYSKRNKAKHN